MTQLAHLVLIGSTIVGAALAVGCDSEEVTGETLFLERHSDGNTFACATCHSLSEPAADGFTRPGHPIGDAAARPHYKNGQLTELLDAVNTCRVEWMAASEWSADDPNWRKLEAFLIEQAPEVAEPIEISIAQPPASLGGGNPMEGQELFNGRCIVCHGENGIGTERAPKITGLGLELDYIAERVRLSGAGNSTVYEGLQGGRMPFWGADRLSDDQLLDIIAYVNTSTESGEGNGTGDGVGELRDCDATHAKIGQTAVLVPKFHNVGGIATIVDDCTIEITDFTFDGTGINVQVYGGLGGDFINGFSMSGDIRRNTPYLGETLVVQLPQGRDLDELDGISIWCVPAGANFGSGDFE